MKPLREFLRDIVENWDRIAIRVYQDNKWQSLFLSEIKNEHEIEVWLIRQLEQRLGLE